MWVHSQGQEDPLEEGVASHGESRIRLELLSAHAHTHTHTRAVKVLLFSPPLPSFKGLLCAIHCPETEDSVVNRIKVLALEKLTFWGE